MHVSHWIGGHRMCAGVSDIVCPYCPHNPHIDYTTISIIISHKHHDLSSQFVICFEIIQVSEGILYTQGGIEIEKINLETHKFYWL